MNRKYLLYVPTTHTELMSATHRKLAHNRQSSTVCYEQVFAQQPDAAKFYQEDVMDDKIECRRPFIQSSLKLITNGQRCIKL